MFSTKLFIVIKVDILLSLLVCSFMFAIINSDNYHDRQHSHRYFRQNNNLRNNYYPQLPSLQALSPRKHNHSKFSLPLPDSTLSPVISSSKVPFEPSIPSQTAYSSLNFIPSSEKPSTVKSKTKQTTNKVSVRFSKYHHYDEMVKLLKNMARKNPNITRLYSIGKSVQGRDLWVMQLSEYVDKKTLQFLFLNILFN